MKNARSLGALILGLGCFVGFPPAASRLYGQAATASISGTITDSSGAAIPEAGVVVKNSGTAVTQTVTTNGQGHYNVPDLPIGGYELQVAKMGFQTAVRKGVTLSVGSAPVIDFQLAVGRSEQTVNVSAEVSEVETTTAALSSLVDQQQMRELPLNGRNFEQLILLAPGVNTYPAGGESALTSRAPAYSIGGARPEGYANILDGEDTLNWWQRGSGASVTGTSLGIEAIAEFQTVLNTYGAEYGGNGAVINAVTKSGTNSFHGSAYDFLRNSDMDARGFFDLKAPPPPFRKNQYGGSVGGPVKKDKVFFFVNYEGIRQLLGQATPVFVPDSNARLGIVGSTTVPVNPVISQILNLFPLPTAPTATPGIGTVTEVANQIAHEDYILARGDWVISDKDSFFGRYLSDKGSQITPSAIPLWPVYDVTHNQFATIGERHIFSSNLINQFSFSFSRPNTGETEPETTPVLNIFTPGRYDVYIGVTGLTAIGANFTNPFRFMQNKFTESESLLWTEGSHSIKIGASFRRNQINSFGQTYWNGDYTFTSLTNFLQAIPLSFTGAPNGQTYTNRDFRDIAVNPYIQDDWKVNRKLTINIGLRYEWQSNPVDDRNILNNVAYPPAGTGYSLVSHAWLTNPSTKNFDPRFGLAYDVFGDHKTSLRAGFAIMHDPLQTYTFFSGYDGTPPFLTENQLICSSPGCTYPAFPTPFATAAQVPLPSLTNGTYDGINTTPYMIQWNVNIEREILPNTILTVGYIGSRGVHLLAFHDFNPPQQTLVNGVESFTNAAGVQNPRLNPNFGALDLTDTTSYSRYNALTTLLKHNFSHSFQAQLSYTWSHCIDDTYTYGGLGGNNGFSAVENPYNEKIDTGSCSYDIRHNIAANIVFLLPFHGNRLKEGWQLTGVESWHTGVPFTVIDGFDRALLQNNFDSERPNYIAGCNVSANQNVHQWFNPNCFQLQQVGTVGNLGRDALTAPGYVDTDFGVLKSTKITEKISAQFRAELFNIFNHPNFSTPSLGVFSSAGTVLPTAGAITAIIGNARQVQFALKILF